eukprot:7504058-Ditylum_brightwellii.AAC.1
MEYEKVGIKLDFGNQYAYFHKDMDSKFPKAIMVKMLIYIFCDANHSHDKKTGRSITGCRRGSSDVEISYVSNGFEVSVPTPIFVDNMSVLLKSTNPGSTLNKKTVALLYHFVREHVADGVVEIRKIDTDDNFADPFTKLLASNKISW